MSRQIRACLFLSGLFRKWMMLFLWLLGGYWFGRRHNGATPDNTWGTMASDPPVCKALHISPLSCLPPPVHYHTPPRGRLTLLSSLMQISELIHLVYL